MGYYCPWNPKPHAAIEIYADGHKPALSNHIWTSKKSSAAKSSLTPVSLNSQQEDYIRKKSQQLGINVDLSKVKTFQVNSGNLSDKTSHQLYVLSVEKAGWWVLCGIFIKCQGAICFPDGPRDLFRAITRQAIQQAVTTSKYPKLLQSATPGKVRIMASA